MRSRNGRCVDKRTFAVACTHVGPTWSMHTHTDTTPTQTQTHTHTHTHTQTHTHTHTSHTQSAHPTPFFNVPVSAKKGSHRHCLAGVFATLPPSLQSWWCEERSGIPPAKKGSLSARACLHRHLINIEDMGEGWGNTALARSRKGTFFRRHRNEIKHASSMLVRSSRVRLVSAYRSFVVAAFLARSIFLARRISDAEGCTAHEPRGVEPVKVVAEPSGPP